MTPTEYLKQPTTILGIAGFVGAVSTAVAHYLTGDVNASALLGVVIASAVHVVMPDNSGAPSSVEKLVTDAVTAAAQKRLAAAMPLLVSDGMNALAAFQAAQQSPALPPTPTAFMPAPQPAAVPAAS